MRKTLAIVLSAIMVLSLAVLGVSAEEPLITIAAAPATEVKTAEEFAAMAADGNYKLVADIAVTASYGDGETIVPFTGTFDGNGHTVTVTVPLFAELGANACIKDLVIGKAGDKIEDAAERHCGALARSISKGSTDVVIENVTNNTDITATAAGSWRRGGLIGQIFDNVTATFTKCTNNGNVLAGNMLGGLVGYIQGYTLTFTDCVNNGSVTIDAAAGLTGNCGGIVGRFGGDNTFTATNLRSITITNCLNTGTMTATSEAAGILAHARGCTVTITNCTNKGSINSVYSSGTTGSSDATGIFGSTAGSKGYYCFINIDKCLNEGKVHSDNARAAGICGYVWCGTYSERYMYATVTNCVNKGAIEGGSFVSQIFAYTNDGKAMEEGQKQCTTITNCLGLGTLSRSAVAARAEEKYYPSVLGFSSSTVPENYNVNISIIENDGCKYYSYTETAANVDSIIEIGKQAAGLVNVITAAKTEEALKALGEIGYVAPAAPVEPEPAVTGDSFAVLAVVALVSVLGMGIALKARKD